MKCEWSDSHSVSSHEYKAAVGALFEQNLPSFSDLVGGYNLTIDVGMWNFQGKNCFCCECANAPPSARPYIAIELVRPEDVVELVEAKDQALATWDEAIEIAEGDISALIDAVKTTEADLTKEVNAAMDEVYEALEKEVDEAKALATELFKEGTGSYDELVAKIDQEFSDVFNAASSAATEAETSISENIATARSAIESLGALAASDVFTLLENTKTDVDKAITDVIQASDEAVARFEKDIFEVLEETGGQKARVGVLHHVKGTTASGGIGAWEGYNDVATAGISYTDRQAVVRDIQHIAICVAQ